MLNLLTYALCAGAGCFGGCITTVRAMRSRPCPGCTRLRAMRSELVDELEQAPHPPTDPDLGRYLA